MSVFPSSVGAAPVREERRGRELGLIGFLASVTMLFAAFTAASLVRRAGADWHEVALPGWLWASSVLAVVSSVTMFPAQREAGRRWLLVTLGLGVLFVVSQVLAWRALLEAGLLAPSHPHASFFYLLTGVHGLYLFGGLVALVWALGHRSARNGCAIYWHFLTGLWLYVLVLLEVL